MLMSPILPIFPSWRRYSVYGCSIDWVVCTTENPVRRPRPCPRPVWGGAAEAWSCQKPQGVGGVGGWGWVGGVGIGGVRCGGGGVGGGGGGVGGGLGVRWGRGGGLVLVVVWFGSGVGLCGGCVGGLGCGLFGRWGGGFGGGWVGVVGGWVGFWGCVVCGGMLWGGVGVCAVFKSDDEPATLIRPGEYRLKNASPPSTVKQLTQDMAGAPFRCTEKRRRPKPMSPAASACGPPGMRCKHRLPSSSRTPLRSLKHARPVEKP